MAEFDPSPRMIRHRAILEFINTRQLSIEDRLKLEALFSFYLGAIDSKVIVLYNRSQETLLKLPYSTRFNDKGRIYEKIDQLYQIFENAIEKHVDKRGKGDAVFLTLTLDPKNFRNVMHASKEAPKALNRFFSFIKKRLKSEYEKLKIKCKKEKLKKEVRKKYISRLKKLKKLVKKLEYINVVEFQRNGIIHFHIVIFGIDWLIPQKELSKIWEKYGMGKIVHIYRLKFSDNEGDFIFYKNKPKNTKTNSITDYLTKYLKKAFYDKSELSLFWLTNKRFFTYSRSLLKKEEKVKPKVKLSRWEFIGVFDTDIFDRYTDEEFIEFFVYNIRRYRRRIKFTPFCPKGSNIVVHVWDYV